MYKNSFPQYSVVDLDWFHSFGPRSGSLDSRSCLNLAIRQALNIPSAPLTQENMLSLTNLNASRRNVRLIDGLETARNLVSLDLEINALTNVAIPGVWRRSI